MDIEFLLKIDFLGIISNLVAIKKQVLDDNHELNFRDHLIETRKMQAQFESFLCSNDKEVILVHNRTPWNTLHDGIEDRMLGSNYIKKIFEFTTEEEEDDDKNTQYFASHEYLGRGIYKIRKHEPIQQRKDKIRMDAINSIVKPSEIHQYSLNICSNHTQTSSNLLQQRLGLSCELCNVLNDKKFLENILRETPPLLQAYFHENQILSIVPYVGKMNETILKSKKTMNETNKQLTLQLSKGKGKINDFSVIYFICHFRSEQHKSLENLSPEVDTLLMNILTNNEEIKRILKICSRIDDTKSFDNSVYLNKLLVRNNTKPDDVGIIFFVTFVESLLEKLDSKKISDMFYSNLKEIDKNKWKVHFSSHERDRLII